MQRRLYYPDHCSKAHVADTSDVSLMYPMWTALSLCHRTVFQMQLKERINRQTLIEAVVKARSPLHGPKSRTAVKDKTGAGAGGASDGTPGAAESAAAPGEIKTR